tara:strand:- start:463 stop:1341 length:879 start_codon:yes stop_codon:yes gene_type:complete
MKKQLHIELLLNVLFFIIICILTSSNEYLVVPLLCISILIFLYILVLYFQNKPKNNYNPQGLLIKDKRYKPNKKITKIIDKFYFLSLNQNNSYNDFKKNFKTLKRVVNQANKKEEINLNNFRISNDKSSSFDWFELGLIEYSINPNCPKNAIYYLTNAINNAVNESTYLDAKYCFYACRGFIFQESGDAESAYSDFKSAFICGNWYALLILLFEYEERIVEELDNHLKNNLNQNELPSIEFKTFITFFVKKLKELGTNFTQLGIDESGSKLLLINEKEDNSCFAKKFICSLE